MKIAERVYLISGVPYGTNSNTYALDTGQGLIFIDAGFSEKQMDIMLENCRAWGLAGKISHVFLTHAHFDHAGNALAWQERGACIAAGQEDAEGMAAGDERTLAGVFGKVFPACRADILLQGGEVFKIGEICLTVIAAPGHSAGSMAFLAEADGKRFLFTGDMIEIAPKPPEDDVQVSPAWKGAADFSEEAFSKTLEKIKETEADVLLPGHYYPWFGKVSELIRKIGVSRQQELEHRTLRLEAYREIQNLMGRFLIYCNFRQMDKALGLMALEEKDVSVEVADDGLFTGKAAVEAAAEHYLGRPLAEGELQDIHLASPIIEVAADAVTARAQWVCPGIGALPRPAGEPQPIWNWGIIGADFICTNGEWKIWHVHWYRLMKCDYELGWVRDVSMENRPNAPRHPLAGPTTYHNPYTPLSIRECIPAVPEPYDTWDGEDWMMKRQGR